MRVEEAFAGLALALLALLACKQSDLSQGGAQVATSQSAPLDAGWDPASCKTLGQVVGRGGGDLGGSSLGNEQLIAYAMNDLRNQAAKLGANFVQHDLPQLGSTSEASTVTTSATVNGTAFHCEKKSTDHAAPEPPADEPSESETACVPGATQVCVGPGGCKGGQSCADDGSYFLPCDCGSAESEARDEAAGSAAP